MQAASVQSRPEGTFMPATTGAAGATGVDAGLFRAGMARMSGACTIITSGHEGDRAGLTATAVCSVSAEPPRLLVCVNRNVWAHDLICASGTLGVNVLAPRHESLARRFAGMVGGVTGSERFLEGDWTTGDAGAPLLRDALVHFECTVAEATASGTHSLFLCDVRAVNAHQANQSALMYFNRHFISAAPPASAC